MAFKFTGGTHQLTEVDLGTQAIEVDGATLYMNRVLCGNISVISGDLYVYNSQVGGVSLSALLGNSLYGSGVSMTSLTLNGGQSSQEVVLDKTHVIGPVISTGDFEVWNTDLVIDSFNNTDYLVNIDGLTGFDLKLHAVRANRNALRLDDCVAGEVYATIIDPSSQTDDTYSGILLEGVCDQLDIRGSIRGGITAANAPQYGIQIGASCTAIDLWLAISGAVTGDVNDLTAGEVTVH